MKCPVNVYYVDLLDSVIQSHCIFIDFLSHDESRALKSLTVIVWSISPFRAGRVCSVYLGDPELGACILDC